MPNDQKDMVLVEKNTTLSTCHKPSPKVGPKTNFACVTLVFLEDWQNERLTSDEVCETLLAAAHARKLIAPMTSDSKEIQRKTSPEVSSRANFAGVTLVFLEDWQNNRLTSDEVCETLLTSAISKNLITQTTTSDDERLQKVRRHRLAREIVHETVTGHISDEIASQIAQLALPPLKQQWVRDQVSGIRRSRKSAVG